MRRTVAVVLLLLAAGLSPAFAGADRPQGAPGGQPKVGERAPDFTLKSLQGESVTLSSLRGKVVFLNFWATWCPPCKAEMPSMERLHEVFAGKDFRMLAVNVEQDLAGVRSFLKEHPHSFTILLDPEAGVQDLYGVYRFPETFLIDRQGKIVGHFIGQQDYSSVEFLKKISSLLGG